MSRPSRMTLPEVAVSSPCEKRFSSSVLLLKLPDAPMGDGDELATAATSKSMPRRISTRCAAGIDDLARLCTTRIAICVLLSWFAVKALVPFVAALGLVCLFENRLRKFARSPAPAATPAPAAPDNRKALVVFGDSLAAGYGLEAGQSFPDDLQKELDAQGYAWHVVNLGISGDTTEGGVARMDSATALKPGIVIVELGGNDGLRGLPLAMTRQNLETMIETFQRAGARVVLAGMTLPPNYGADYIGGLPGGRSHKDLAAKLPADFHPLFLLSDIVTSDLRYLQHDGYSSCWPTAQQPRLSRERCCAPSSRCCKKEGPLLAPPVRRCAGLLRGCSPAVVARRPMRRAGLLV